MFGWLTARTAPICQAAITFPAYRVRRVSLRAFLHGLPRLGSVLYVYDQRNTVLTDAWPMGWVATQRASAPLLDTCWLLSMSTVTADGPREWCECIDILGRTRARLHLLPDTDYLAWDTLTSMGVAADAPVTRNTGHPFQPDRARVISFVVRELAGMHLLEQATPVTLSRLGADIAARIARGEAVLLPQ